MKRATLQTVSIAVSRAVGIAALVVGCSPAAAAAEDAPKSFRDFQACRAIAEDAARLACFDRTAAALDASVKTKEVMVVEREEVRKTKRKLFGFALDEKSVFGDTGDAETTQITTKITSVRQAGQFILVGVETGGTWQTTEYYGSTPRVGTDVTIKKGALGSFFLRFDKGVGVRGKRVQ